MDEKESVPVDTPEEKPSGDGDEPSHCGDDIENTKNIEQATTSREDSDDLIVLEKKTESVSSVQSNGDSKNADKVDNELTNQSSDIGQVDISDKSSSGLQNHIGVDANSESNEKSDINEDNQPNDDIKALEVDSETQPDTNG